MQSGRAFVEIGKAGRHTGDIGRIVAAVKHVDALDHLRQQRLDGAKTLVSARAGLGDFEYFGFGLIEQLPRFTPGRAVGTGSDLGADLGELTHDRALAHDLGVAPNIGGAWRVDGQHADVGQAADGFEFGVALEGFADGDHIRGTIRFDELGNVLIDAAVVVTIKIVLADQVGDFVPRDVLQHQSAEHGLLRLNGMGRDAQQV